MSEANRGQGPRQRKQMGFGTMTSGSTGEGEIMSQPFSLPDAGPHSIPQRDSRVGTGVRRRGSWVWSGRKRVVWEEARTEVGEGEDREQFPWVSTFLTLPLGLPCIVCGYKSKDCRFSSWGMKIKITHLWRRTHLWLGKWNDCVHSSEAAMQWISNWLTSK